MDTIINLESRSGSSNVFKNFWDRLSKVLFHASAFFRFDIGRLSLSDTMAFGAINFWIATVISFFISTVYSVVLVKFFEEWVQRLIISETNISLDLFPSESLLWQAGFVVLAPFIFFLRAIFSTLVLYVFAKIFIEDDHRGLEKLNYKNLLRIQSVSIVSEWYKVVPIFGSVLAFIVHKILLITGLRERYSISTKRALAVVIGPYVILFFFALMILSLFIIGLSQLPFDQLLDTSFLEANDLPF
ncbi:MAG: hypothetical protein M9962_07020 [Oligoflexia bacterium]|nr:hypothetical protein [Oligoflexia bacterium]